MSIPGEGPSGTMYYDQVCMVDLSLLWFVVLNKNNLLTICLNGHECLVRYDSPEACEAAYHAIAEARKSMHG